MKPLDVIGGGDTDSQLQLELRPAVEATGDRIRYQNPNPQNPGADLSLNPLLQRLGVGDNPSINPKPEQLLNNIASKGKSKEILERALSDNHAHRLAIEAFSAYTGLRQNAIDEIINNAVEQTDIVASYGTSGTESNSKEMVNTYQLIQHLRSKSNDKRVTGLYFVADSGHSVYRLVGDICNFFYPNDQAAKQQFLSDLESLKPLVGSSTNLNQYPPLVIKLKSLISDRVKNENLKSALLHILDKADQQNLTFADLITAWHSFCQFVFLYDMSGRDISQMPIVITCRFSSLIPDIPDDSFSFTVSDLIDMFDNYLPEKKVVLFYLVNQDGEDVPVYNTDFSQEDNDQNDQDGERERKRRVREFLSFREINKSSKIKDLNVGPLSGKTYYLLLQKIAQSYASPNRKSPLVLYLDDYERPLETEKLIAEIVRRRECAISYVTTGSRFWVTLTPSEHPYADDRNLAIGAAPPAWMVADLLSRLNQDQIRRLEEFLKEGTDRLGSLENGMTVLFLGNSGVIRLEVAGPSFVYPQCHSDVANLLDKLGTNQKEKLIEALIKLQNCVVIQMTKRIQTTDYSESITNIQDELIRILRELSILLQETELETLSTRLELNTNNQQPLQSYQEYIDFLNKKLEILVNLIQEIEKEIEELESQIRLSEGQDKTKIKDKVKKINLLNKLLKLKAVLAYLVQILYDLRPIYTES